MAKKISIVRVERRMNIPVAERESLYRPMSGRKRDGQATGC